MIKSKNVKIDAKNVKKYQIFKFTVRLCSKFFCIHGSNWMGPTK